MEKIDQADRALAIYNGFAEKNRLTTCARLTPKRRSWLNKRLQEIGGLENFERAVSAIAKDDWLMGRVARNGRPFDLTLDRLLYTGDAVGDRLAGLLDAALQAERAWWAGRSKEMLAAMPDDFWEPIVRDHANGTWNASKICMPPGHLDCPLSAALIKRMGLMEKYGPTQKHKWVGLPTRP